MTPPQLLLRAAALPTLLLALASAGSEGGYHYERPTAAPPARTGHYFAPLPTLRPLPAVPSLPPLPTARSTSRVHTQTLIQTHPPSQRSFPATAPRAAAPRQAVVSQIAQSYRPPSAAQQPQPTALAFGQRIGVTPTAFAPTAFAPTAFAPSAPTAPAGSIAYQPLAPSGFDGPLNPPASGIPPVVPADPAPPQPLRIPFGKQAIITPVAGAVAGAGGNAGANGGYYDANGRQVKQYAVIEIIDNDIEMERMAPFLGSNYFDSARAQIGASGTGAAAGGLQLDSRANALLQEQQRLTIQPPSSAGRTASDSISLGSGGLGYIRLPNGNVYLGSGSLGYISDQQRTQLLRDARTRSGAPVPDALHFGHGPHGGSLNGFRFK